MPTETETVRELLDRNAAEDAQIAATMARVERVVDATRREYGLPA